jgi:hypothetical protein
MSVLDEDAAAKFSTAAALAAGARKGGSAASQAGLLTARDRSPEPVRGAPTDIFFAVGKRKRDRLAVRGAPAGIFFAVGKKKKGWGVLRHPPPARCRAGKGVREHCARECGGH